MSTEKTYNGWTSYATWRVNLEICNDDLDGIAQDVSAGYRDSSRIPRNSRTI